MTCPIIFLQQIHERLNEGGVLMLTSTYDWELNNIKREHWPGGFKKDGEPVTSFEGIKEILSKNFTLEKEPMNLQFTSWKNCGSENIGSYRLEEKDAMKIIMIIRLID